MNRKEERVSLKTFQEKRLGNIEEIYSKELCFHMRITHSYILTYSVAISE